MTGAKPDPEAAADAALEAVAAIIDELEAIMSSVADELRPEWGHPERVKRWEQLLGRCSSPQVGFCTDTSHLAAPKQAKPGM